MWGGGRPAQDAQLRTVQEVHASALEGCNVTKLVIVESPAKGRTISGYLGKEYEVEASIGHIRDLPQPSELPADMKKAETFMRYNFSKKKLAHLM